MLHHGWHFWNDVPTSREIYSINVSWFQLNGDGRVLTWRCLLLRDSIWKDQFEYHGMTMAQHSLRDRAFRELVRPVLVLFVRRDYWEKCFVHATNQFHPMDQPIVVSVKDKVFVKQLPSKMSSSLLFLIHVPKLREFRRSICKQDFQLVRSYLYWIWLFY